MLSISKTGNVGIGTTGPAQMLHIESSNDTSVLRLMETTGQDSIWDLRAAANNSFHISGSTDGSSTTAMFTISDTGKVGIGATAPDTALEIAGAHISSIGLLHIDSTDHAYMMLDAADSNSDSGIYFAEVKSDGSINQKTASKALNKLVLTIHP